MKLAAYKKRLNDTFKYFINSFFMPLGGFADEKQKEIENEAINLVIKKYGKGLVNKLKGMGATPSYRRWHENDCFVSIAVDIYQEDTWSAMYWFSVNACSESAEILKSE